MDFDVMIQHIAHEIRFFHHEPRQDHVIFVFCYTCHKPVAVVFPPESKTKP